MYTDTIKKLRKINGMSTEELAKELNVKVTVIRGIESGVRKLSVNDLAAIAKFFGVSTDYILGRETALYNSHSNDWKQFRESGLLWLINKTLHVFGWAIKIEYNGDEFVGAYPSRVKYRGFDEKTNTDGYIKISEYMAKHATELLEESKS